MINKTEIGEALKTEMDSSLLTYQNYDSEETVSRLNCTIEELVEVLHEKDPGFKPVGFCRHTPVPDHMTPFSVGFVYRINGELRWCHLMEELWFLFLQDIYGRQMAYDIVYGRS